MANEQRSHRDRNDGMKDRKPTSPESEPTLDLDTSRPAWSATDGEPRQPSGKPLRRLPFLAASILVGVVSALAAVLLHLLIAFFHNLLFLGRLSLQYDANQYTPASPWGPLIVAVPVLGAAGAVLLARRVAPQIRGTGVPEVLEAIYYAGGKIRAIVAPAKLLASSLSIGSGAPVGREGPMIQVGAVIGSASGRFITMSAWQRITLMAAGVAGAIAATFNTPLGGILFAIDVLMHEVSVRTLVPIAFSSVTATYIARLILGAGPFFALPAAQLGSNQVTTGGQLLLYAGLGVVLGLVAAGLIRSVFGLQDLLENRLGSSYYLRHMAAMLAVGVLMYLLMVTLGHYYIGGVSHGLIQDLLSGAGVSVGLLLLLALAKWLATSLALGSGAPGGIFSPALYMGALLGGAYGLVVRQLFSGLDTSPAGFVVAGMAGLVGGTTGAALASIVMLLEMTLDYSLIVPLTATVAVSYAVRKLFLRDSIYTLGLVRRGHAVPEALQGNLHFLTPARQMMSTQFALIPATTTLEELKTEAQTRALPTNLVAVRDDEIVGWISRERVLANAAQGQDPATPIGKLVRQRYAVVDKEISLLEVVAQMQDQKAEVALVASQVHPGSGKQIQGVITKDLVADYVGRATDWYHR